MGLKLRLYGSCTFLEKVKLAIFSHMILRWVTNLNFLILCIILENSVPILHARFQSAVYKILEVGKPRCIGTEEAADINLMHYLRFFGWSVPVSHLFQSFWWYSSKFKNHHLIVIIWHLKSSDFLLNTAKNFLRKPWLHSHATTHWQKNSTFHDLAGNWTVFPQFFNENRLLGQIITLGYIFCT